MQPSQLHARLADINEFITHCADSGENGGGRRQFVLTILQGGAEGIGYSREPSTFWAIG